MAKPPGKCIFCGAGGLTKEHMYANWLRNFIPREMIEHRTFTSSESLTQRTISIERRTGDPHSRRIRCVCRTCNNGWMGQLQEDTKPFLAPMLCGESTSLHRRAQKLIATWVTMTVMVAEFTNRDQIAISNEERLRFFNTVQPLPHWRIWIGRHQRRTYSLWTHNCMPFTEEKAESIVAGVEGEPNAQTSTILLGEHVIIHVMSSIVARRIIRLWPLPPSVAPLMSQIWPVRNSHVAWPPVDALDDIGIRLLADQLYDGVLARGRRVHNLVL